MNEVRPLIEKAFAEIPEVEALLYSPDGAPRAEAMKMELLSTVHWVAQESDEAKIDVAKNIEAVHAWSERKKTQFSAWEIEITWERLKNCGYI